MSWLTTFWQYLKSSDRSITRWPLLLMLLSITSEAQRQREVRVPMEIPGVQGNYLAPSIDEMRGYFITIIIALLAFLAKEIYFWLRRRNDTTAQDLIELKKNDMIIMNKLELILEKISHKADKHEVTKEIVDRIERELGREPKVR